MDTENYISPNKITKQYDITSGTLRRWSEAGKIRCIRPNGGKRIYNIDDVHKIFCSQKENLDNVDIVSRSLESIHDNLVKSLGNMLPENANVYKSFFEKFEQIISEAKLKLN